MNRHERRATFVATFADGETVRMRTHCRDALDWERGKKLAVAAWQTRSWQRRVNPEFRRLKVSYPDCKEL
jgi:intergrase/recombinase